jgi:hypothetical protein
MKSVLIILAIALAAVLMGCATTSVYTPGGVTDNSIEKVGEGPSTDGIVSIAKSAGITKIATVDYTTERTYWYWTVLFGNSAPVKVEQTLIVSGE